MPARPTLDVTPVPAHTLDLQPMPIVPDEEGTRRKRSRCPIRRHVTLPPDMQIL
ncbi:hypothetical protein HYPSUDRAFT_68564 [Hypholoma sublateritium FD-334 SS-4]|uniref:Uncharacterized protein n=1 Tax=Hypholoma sublateritium (strain FD-334 SS-4) TaxID=945553 RepID=A0A0D2NNF7_HYPSF|nr:hypothetical protein HYPSUDRAFT_68564 [Hypholoma sublateritium FD-334 SS-4]